METFQVDMNKIQGISQFMKELLALNSSKEKKDLYLKYQDIISSVSAMDIMYLDMYQEDNEYSIEEVKKEAGKFVNLFRHPLTELQPKSYDSVLLTLLLEENKKIRDHFEFMKKYISNEMETSDFSELKKGFEKCAELEKDYLKKENILFPILEEKIPSKKPLGVLWELHDDARVLQKELVKMLSVEVYDNTAILLAIVEYYDIILGIKDKEELILYPVSNQLISSDILDAKLKECLEYGFAFLDDVNIELPTTMAQEITEGHFQSKTGYLSFEQLEQMLNHLPFDMTFVDKDDKVAYFNNNPSRHFSRNASIIGRKVEFCHPPKSVHIVKKIVESFKNNLKDQALFRIHMKDKWLLITYYAVRNEQKEYLGTLEVSQDITDIMKMEGEIRLLDWDE